MSKKYMSRPPYCVGSGVPDYYTGPPMTVEEYKACEAKYFDFLKPEEPEIEQPVGAFERLLQFIGMSKSTTLDGDGTHVQESSSKSQSEVVVNDKLRSVSANLIAETKSEDDGDKEKTVRVSPQTERREKTDEVDHKTVTSVKDIAEAENDVNSNTSSYRLREEPAVPNRDLHAVSSQDSDKEFNSCQLQFLEEAHDNGSINQDKEIPRKTFLKSIRKFFRRPFGRCLRAEE